MSSNPYAADKLISQARILAAEYRRTMGRPLPGVSVEIAEHDAIRLLHLEPNPDKQGGWDALDPRSGLHVQIKSRMISDSSKGGERLGQLKLGQDWDSVALVLMDENYEASEIFMVFREDIEEFMYETNSNRAKRGSMTVARFKKMGNLVWSKEKGLDHGAME